MKWIICAGAFGGIAPNVFRMGTNLTAGKELPDVSYLIGVLIFAGMGAGIAAAFQESDPKKAFFLGLSLPAMFQSSVADLSSSPARTAELFFPSAYAATLSSSEQPPKELVLAFDREAPAFSVVYVGKGRKELVEVDLEKGAVPRTLIAPAWAEEFFVVVEESESASRRFRSSGSRPPDPGFFDYGVRITPDVWNGLKQSVGIRGSARWKIEVLTPAELKGR